MGQLEVLLDGSRVPVPSAPIPIVPMLGYAGAVVAILCESGPEFEMGKRQLEDVSK